MTASFMASGMRPFLKKRAIELIGILLIFCVIALALALGSYHPSDPSWNTATTTPPQNMMGIIGAYAADMLLQLFGFASFLALPILACWGWQLIRHKKVRFLYWKLAGLVVFLSVTTQLFPEGAFEGTLWPMLPRNGSIGIIVNHGVQTLLGMQPLPYVVFICVFWAISFTLFTTLMGIKWRTWGEVILGIASGSVIIAHNLYPLLRWAVRPPRHKKGGSATQTPERTTPVTPKALSRKKEKVLPTEPAPQPHIPTPKKMRGDLGYHYPPIDLLTPPKHHKYKTALSPQELTESGQMLSHVLDDFGVKGTITDISPGPVVTLYKLKPAPGTKSSRVVSLSEDIARSMSAISARIAVIPGHNALGIELPNPERQTVSFREQVSDKSYTNTTAKLPLILGKDIGGEPVIADLAKMPHLLVAGTTGSGKSVSINTMILSLLYHLSPEQCRFIMIDPKMLELSVYDGIPHLLAPVVTDPHKAIMALKWVVREMEDRYQNMAKLNVRNIDGYNQRISLAKDKGEILTRKVQTGFDAETGAPTYETQELSLDPLPYIVVIVDEMADLMLVAGKDIEGAIQRLAQMARAAGIHLIMATQRPSVDVITGTIKANFPTRISFQVTSKIDSRTILGEQGAEQLLGQGDMLYMAAGGRVTRIHGPFVSDQEVEKVVQFLKTQGTPSYIEEVTLDAEGGSLLGGMDQNADDPLYQQALDLITRERKASTSFIQRHLKIGYNRAASLIDALEAQGVVSPANHVGKREILLPETDR